MKPQKCFPYSYGDEGGSLVLSPGILKVGLFALIATTPIFILPTLAGAADAELILLRIEQALKELDRTKPYTRGISPIGGLSCVISGICMSQAKIALVKGNIPASAAFVSGAAIALCCDRIAAYNGF